MSSIRKHIINGVKTGDTFSLTRTFHEEDMVAFGNITRDFNPVHYNDKFSELKGLKGRICHGFLVGSIGTEIGGQMGLLAAGASFTFKYPVYFGDTIKCEMTVTEIDDNNRMKGRAVYTNQDGVIVMDSVVSGILPNDDEKRIMRQMMETDS